MSLTPSHAIVVGGTGMLSALGTRLVQDGWRVSIVARHASRFVSTVSRAGLLGFDCDYQDATALCRVLDDACMRLGPARLAVAWIHSTAPDGPRQLAEQLVVSGSPLRYLHVLGSAVADPARPDRLDALRVRVTSGLASFDYAQAVLGFAVENGRSRWLTHEEISNGAYDAALSARPLSIIGTVTPWSARP